MNIVNVICRRIDCPVRGPLDHACSLLTCCFCPLQNVDGGKIVFNFAPKAERVHSIGLLDVDYKTTLYVRDCFLANVTNECTSNDAHPCSCSFRSSTRIQLEKFEQRSFRFPSSEIIRTRYVEQRVFIRLCFRVKLTSVDIIFIATACGD